MGEARRGFGDGAARFRMSAVKWAMNRMGNCTSGRYRVLLSISAPSEIDVLGLFETAFAVDHGVDLVIRKNEPIFGRFVG